MTPAPERPIEADLNLDAEGEQTWGNLGLWQPGDDYSSAARRLALQIATAAQLSGGDRLLDLGFGTGQQWSLWRSHFGAAAITGFEPDPTHFARAAPLAGADDRVIPTRAAGLDDVLDAASFDSAVAVDAAYHFTDRSQLLASLVRALKPGARLAWSDLVLANGRTRASGPLAIALRLAGIPPENLCDADGYRRCIERVGLRDVRIERQDEAVLDGFAAWWPSYRRRHRVNRRMWLRAELTARFLARDRARRRLGYVIVSARTPAAPVPPKG